MMPKLVSDARMVQQCQVVIWEQYQLVVDLVADFYTLLTIEATILKKLQGPYQEVSQGS